MASSSFARGKEERSADTGTAGKLLGFVEQSNVEIGGRSGFIFNTKHGHLIMPVGVNSFLKNIVNAYNKKENWKKRSESRS